MGDKVWIKAISADLGKRQLDYEWILKPGENGDNGDRTEKIKSHKNKEGRKRR
jgi:ribonuclease R